MLFTLKREWNFYFFMDNFSNEDNNAFQEYDCQINSRIFFFIEKLGSGDLYYDLQLNLVSMVIK